VGPKTFQCRPSFSLANAQKYRFCATFILSDNHVVYLTVILRTRVEYELIADEARSAESAIAHIRRE
jgi:hypothetical protein